MQANTASEPKKVRVFYLIALVLASINGALLAIVLFAVAGRIEPSSGLVLTQPSQDRPAPTNHQRVRESSPAPQAVAAFVATSIEQQPKTETKATVQSPTRTNAASRPSTSEQPEDVPAAGRQAASPERDRESELDECEKDIAHPLPQATRAASIADVLALAESTSVPLSMSAAAGPLSPTTPVECDSRDAPAQGRSLGTAFDWEESVAAAETRAAREHKLMLILHVSGNFELPEFT